MAVDDQEIPKVGEEWFKRAKARQAIMRQPPNAVAVKITYPETFGAMPEGPTWYVWRGDYHAGPDWHHFTERQARAVATVLNDIARTDAIEHTARAHYEAHREGVEGRPAWEELKPLDTYDRGMIELARNWATSKINEYLYSKRQEHGQGSG